MKIGDLCFFSEDGWATTHSGVIADESHYSFFVKSQGYGNLWVSKSHTLEYQAKEITNPVLQIGQLLGRDPKITEQYQTDPLFRSCVDSLAHGYSPVVLLSDVCKLLSRVYEERLEQIIKSHPSGVINPPNYEQET